MIFLCMKGAKDLQVFDVPMTTMPEQMSSNLHSLKPRSHRWNHPPWCSIENSLLQPSSSSSSSSSGL